jgi:hypothetical protein
LELPVPKIRRIAFLTVLSLLGANPPGAAGNMDGPHFSEELLLRIFDEEHSYLKGYLTCASLEPELSRRIREWWSEELEKIRALLEQAGATGSQEISEKVASLTIRDGLVSLDMPLGDAARFCDFPEDKAELSPLFRFMVQMPTPSERVASALGLANSPTSSSEDAQAAAPSTTATESPALPDLGTETRPSIQPIELDTDAEVLRILDDEAQKATIYLTCTALETTEFNVTMRWWQDSLMEMARLVGSTGVASTRVVERLVTLANPKTMFDPTATLSAAQEICAYPDGQVERSPLYAFRVYDLPKPVDRLREAIERAQLSHGNKQ